MCPLTSTVCGIPSPVLCRICRRSRNTPSSMSGIWKTPGGRIWCLLPIRAWQVLITRTCSSFCGSTQTPTTAFMSSVRWATAPCATGTPALWRSSVTAQPHPLCSVPATLRWTPLMTSSPASWTRSTSFTLRSRTPLPVSLSWSVCCRWTGGFCSLLPRVWATPGVRWNWCRTHGRCSSRSHPSICTA